MDSKFSNKPFSSPVISFGDLNDDQFFGNETDEETESITKREFVDNLSSDHSQSDVISRPKFDLGGEDSATSDTFKDKPVVFKLRGNYKSMHQNMLAGKTDILRTKNKLLEDNITGLSEKADSISREYITGSSEESIPSDDCSDEEVEIIGEKPGSGKDKSDMLSGLEDERPPSDEESAEEIDSDDEDDDEDIVEELSSDEMLTDEEDNESELSDEIAEEASSSHIGEDSVPKISTSDVSEKHKQPLDLDHNKIDESDGLKVAKTNSNNFDENMFSEEDTDFVSEITFNDLKEAEEDKITVPDIAFAGITDNDLEPSKSFESLKSCEDKVESNDVVSSTVPEQSTKKEEEHARDPSSGKKKRKRKREKDPNKKEKKKGTKRRKKEKSSEDSQKTRKKTFERKNIRKIIKEKDLDEETVRAQNEELERKQRMQEKIERLKQSQLQSLLEDDDELPDDEERNFKVPDDIQRGKIEDAEVVEISSDEDDVHMLSVESEEPGEPLDPNNSGSHVNDAMNQPDAEGRVLVNVGHPPDEPDIFLAPLLAANVKPHQIGGIRFLYDNLVESLQQYKGTNGFGCILAHSMGLGKTLQVISFVDVFLRFSEGQRVLIIVPVNTLQNWMNEFNMWLPPEGKAKPDEGVWPRLFKVFLISDAQKNNLSRLKVVEDWYKQGGCLLMGYEMYRLLTSKKVAVSRPKRPKGSEPVLIDLVEEEKNTELMIGLKTALVSPGPDLIICDEGHRIKNSLAGISQSLKNIKTRRRVVLTGYPLQNNLQEYWCMVDFTRPNFLGTKTEFANMFERPIMNGQCVDSTPQDHRLMRFRAHVLHSLLEGFVQRRSHDVLRRALPPKEEHVLLVKMSSVQRCLYKAFMDSLEQTEMGEMASANPLKAFSVCCKIWNHPDILNQIVEQRRMEDNDLDIEDAKMDGEGGSSGSKTGRRGKGKGTLSDFKKSASNPELTMPYLNDKQTTISYDWAHEHLKDYQQGVIENSGKLVILLSILEKSLEIGDKVLVFSQSLFTLTLIEDYLSKLKIPNTEEYWTKNKNYFRLDGSTVSQDREKLISQFNAPDNTSVHLFLLSTRAGCLGINLIGANRVVVFDASWNPCHDCQAVCRVYRYGQTRNCYVYRLVMDLTMEKKIYDRQINKQGMSNRVVDELNPINSLTRRQVDVLLQYEDADPKTIDPSLAEDKHVEDPILYQLIKRHNQWITKVPFSHESLLIDRKDQRLTTTEKKLAHQGYEMEKKMSSSYNRPSYSAFYPRAGPTVRPITIRRPIASVRPMMQPPVMTTPIPMQPRGSGQQHTLVGEVSRPPATKIIGPGASKISTAPPALLKPGVSVQQIKLKSDIPIPNSTTADGSLQRIPAGENVLVIKTPKGVYIRTPGGKIFAVRSAPKEAETSDTNMQDIITKSVAAATKIQEETGAKPSTVTVTVSASGSSIQGEQQGVTTQKVISITPKISIVKSTVQRLKSDSSTEASPHVLSITDSSRRKGKSSKLNMSVIKSSPKLSVLKSSVKDSSSDDDISIVSLKQGKKARKEAAANRPKDLDTSHITHPSNKEVVSETHDHTLVSQHFDNATDSQKLDSLTQQSDNGPVSQKVSQISDIASVSQSYGNTLVSQISDNAQVSIRNDNPPVSRLSDNVPISQRYENTLVSQKSNDDQVSQGYANTLVPQKSGSIPVSQKYKKPAAVDRLDSPLVSQIMNPPFSQKHDNMSFPQKSDSPSVPPNHDNSPVSRNYHQPIPQPIPQTHKNPQISQKYDNMQVSQKYSKPAASQKVENTSAPTKYDKPQAGQTYDNSQMTQNYNNSTSSLGARGFPFYAPSFNGPSQYMPWMAPGEPYGYPPQYGWGMGAGYPMYPTISPQTSNTYPSAQSSEGPSLPSGGGSFPNPYPSSHYPTDPYCMSNPSAQPAHNPGRAPASYNPESQAASSSSYNATETPVSSFDTMNGDSNSLDSLVKDFDIDLTHMQNSADVENFGL